jgi:hypothetical protein
MRSRTFIAAACAAALLGGTAALVVPAVASARTSTHTLRFTSVTERTVMFTKTTGAQQDRDVARGRLIGFDQLNFTVNPVTGAATGGVTLDASGGFMYFAMTFAPNGQSAQGKVTGGTGAYQGATGKITAKAQNKSGTRTAVTVTYRARA